MRGSETVRVRMSWPSGLPEPALKSTTSSAIWKATPISSPKRPRRSIAYSPAPASWAPATQLAEISAAVLPCTTWRYPARSDARGEHDQERPQSFPAALHQPPHRCGEAFRVGQQLARQFQADQFAVGIRRGDGGALAFQLHCQLAPARAVELDREHRLPA